MKAEQGWLQTSTWEGAWKDVLCLPHRLTLLVILVSSTAVWQRDREETGGCKLIDSKYHSSLWWPSLQCSLLFHECRKVSAGLKGSRWPYQMFVTWCPWHAAVLGEWGQLKIESRSVFAIQTKLNWCLQLLCKLVPSNPNLSMILSNSILLMCCWRRPHFATKAALYQDSWWQNWPVVRNSILWWHCILKLGLIQGLQYSCGGRMSMISCGIKPCSSFWFCLILKSKTK